MPSLFQPLCLALLLLLARPVAALPILDQLAEPPDTSANASLGDFERAQIFTVGVTGTLTGVEVLVSRNTAGSTLDLDVRILPVVGGAPDDDLGNALATATISDSAIPVGTANAAFVLADLSSAGLAVTAGDTFAIALQTNLLALDQQDWTLGLELYDGGTAWFRQDVRDAPGATWAIAGGGAFDFGFRTYVEAPEPGAVALLALAAAGLAARRASGRD